jgi:hypothetical protein
VAHESGNEDIQSRMPRDFLLEDYRLKVEYFSSHLSRMWTRFNFLLTIDSALFALYATREKLEPDTRLLFLLTGLVLSGLWSYFGVIDIIITNTYRKHIEDAHGQLVNRREHHPYVGKMRGQISPVYIAIVLPLGFFLVWLYLLVQ